jgi:iron complex outermembrane receptor protein
VTVSTTRQADADAPTQGYVVKSSKSATKTDTDLKEIPQAITVVTRKQVEDQDAQTVAAALGYSAGTFNAGRGAYTRYDNVVLRGFDDGMTTNQYLDGLRLIADASSGAQIQLDPYFLERIEVVRGPGSTVYGQTAPGGLIASTSKLPTGESVHEIEMTVGSRQQRSAAFDIGGALGENVSYRVVGKAGAADSMQDDNRTEKYALAPSLAWRIDARNRLVLQAYLEHSPAIGANGSLPYRGTVVDHNGQRLSTGTYDGTAGDGFAREQQFYGYQFQHDFNDNWSFRQNARYQRVRLDGVYAYQVGWNGSDTALSRSATSENTQSNAWLLDNQLAGRFATGIVRHALLVGLDYQKIDTRDAIGYAGNIGDLDPSSPNDSASLLDALASGYRYRYSRHNSQTGLYWQDQLALDHWRLTLGLRHDQASTRQSESVYGSSSTWSGGKLTHRAALSYLADSGLAPYYSYSEGFSPSLSGYTDTQGHTLEPRQTRQHELGIKYQPAGSDTLLTAALYQLDQNNLARYNSSLLAYESVGSARSRGLELEARTRLGKKLTLLASYTRTRMKLTAGDNAGNTPVMAPDTQASLWADYDLGNGAGLGGGVRYIGSMWADNENTARLPAYTLLDMALRLQLERFVPAWKGVALRVNASNLLDKTYVASCYDLDSCYYGTRRTLSATLSYAW